MRRRQRAKDQAAEEAAAAHTNADPTSAAEMAQAQKTWVVIAPSNLPSTNRALPAVPRDVGEDDDSDSDATPRASNITGSHPGDGLLRNAPSSTWTMSSATPLLGVGARRGSSRRHSQRLSQVDADFIPVLPNPFHNSEEETSIQRALPAIQTEANTRPQPRSRASGETTRRQSTIDDDGSYSPSFMSSPITAHLRNSLIFSSTAAETIASTLSASPSSPTAARAVSAMVPLTLSLPSEYEPNSTALPSQWLSRSPTSSAGPSGSGSGTGGTGTLLEDMVVHQKQLEADHGNGEGRSDPPPKYSIEAA